MAILMFNGRIIDCTDVFIHRDIIEYYNNETGVTGQIKYNQDRPLLTEIDGNVNYVKALDLLSIKGNIIHAMYSSHLMLHGNCVNINICGLAETGKDIDKFITPIKIDNQTVALDTYRQLIRTQVKYKVNHGNRNKLLKKNSGDCKFQILHIRGNLNTYKAYAFGKKNYSVVTEINGNVTRVRTLLDLYAEGIVKHAVHSSNNTDFIGLTWKDTV